METWCVLCKKKKKEALIGACLFTSECLSRKSLALLRHYSALHVLIKPLGEAEVVSPTLDGSDAPV